MKIQKLDSKQVPQVVALGVLSVGVFGYAVFTFAGSAPKPAVSAPANAAASGSTETSASSATTAPATSTTSAGDTKMALSVAENGVDPKTGAQGTPEIVLPGQYNPDPFKSTAKSVAPPQTVQVTPKPAAPKASKPAPQLPDSRLGPALPQVTAVPTLIPLGPERPEVRVTGTSVVDGMNLAILELGQEHRVVQVGDVVSKGYRVKKIQLQGVVFGKDKDRFFRGVGAKSEPEKPDNTLGKLNPF